MQTKGLLKLVLNDSLLFSFFRLFSRAIKAIMKMNYWRNIVLATIWYQEGRYDIVEWTAYGN